MAVESTMQDLPLSLTSLLRHGARVYPDSLVVSYNDDRRTETTFADTAARAKGLARGLRALGVRSDDRVGTFAWNTQEHLDAYFAVPAMGAVVHTLNVRLHPDQLAYVVNHAEDRVILVDRSLVPLLAAVADRLPTVEHYVVIGGDGGDPSLPGSTDYGSVLDSGDGEDPFRIVDERAAAMLCYTTGTTGPPKGVAYSHRSIYLHTLMLCSGNLYALNEDDRLLVTVPLFHGMAMGIPYAGWMVGADLLLPGARLQAAPIARLVAAERPTWAGAVPVIWNDILRYSEEHDVDLSSLRVLACGGSAVPRAFIETFQQRLGVQIVQGWGMTETNPVAAVNAHPPKRPSAEEAEHWMERSGRVVPGVEVRVVGRDGVELPWDGRSTGELEVRGPWVTGSYFREPAADRFHDGWLRTGDVGVIHEKGFVRITDRLKDVIKSGGEWISSVEVEAHLSTHSAVDAVAVVGVPDEKWQERPLACVVVRDGATVDASALRDHLAGRVASFWVPEYWAFVPELPQTTVGKIDKNAIRTLVDEGDIVPVREAKPPTTSAPSR